MMNPVVSVIIPSYNTAALVGRAVGSALSQTLAAIEVIVVDDASVDESVAVVRACRDPRLQLIALAKNEGAGSARNRAIAAARGRWVAVLDSDDWYAPTRLERLVVFAETSGADIVADDLYPIREGAASPWGTLLGAAGARVARGPIDAVTLLESENFGRGSQRLGLCKPLFSSEFLLRHGLRYDPSIKVTQDFWLLLECLVRGARFELWPEPLYFYLSRAGSLVTSSRQARLMKDGEVAAAVMARPEVAADGRLAAALERKRRQYSRPLAFEQVVSPLKAGRWGAAGQALVRDPGVVLLLLRRLLEALRRRFRHYVLRDEAAFDMLQGPEGRRR